MEFLAPCGGPEHLKAAVYAGAGAVYLGGPGFSARRAAVNFSLDDLREAARFCWGFGVKMYVAVNILARDDEWDDLRAYLTALAGVAPDALIVQDIGVARLCRALIPGMPLHASTQLSVHTAAGVRFCEELGFTRVVVGRECGRDVLSEIIEKSNIGVEVFVHGALCVSVSGQCRLSAVIGGRSGNRGLCAQPCRLDFAGGGRRHALSLKDGCLIPQIPLLEKMGVRALKIEGRMKRPEYVAAAVTACRAALAGETPNLDELRAVFSRGGFTQGYFTGDHRDMGGVRTREDVRDTETVLPRLAGQTRAPSRRVPVDMRFEAGEGRDCALTLTDGVSTAAVYGPAPQPAVRREAARDEIVKLLSRIGDTPFAARDVSVRVEPGLFIPASQVNAMRREACSLLLERRVARLTPVYAVVQQTTLARKQFPSPPPDVSRPPVLRVHCRTLAQARAVWEHAGQVVLDVDIAGAAPDAGGEKLMAAPDRFITDEGRLIEQLTALKEKGILHLLCENPAHAVIGRRLGYALHGGLGLNVFNRESAAFWAAYGFTDITVSMELKLSECLGLFHGGDRNIPAGVAAYGRLPLMLLRRCPFDRACEQGQCRCPRTLTDRTGRAFPLRCSGEWRELLNADTLWMAMADRLEKLNGAAFLSLLLFDETPERAVEIVRAHRAGGAPPPGLTHTRGLLERGVL